MSPPTQRRAFVAAPILLLAGLAAMKLGWNAEPDVGWPLELSLWTGAHLLSVAGYLAYGVVLVALWSAARRGAGRGLVDLVGAVGALGLVAVLGQMVIDLAIGFRAGSRAGMEPVADAVQGLPGVETLFYGAVPAMQLVAVVVLVVVLALRRAVPARTAAAFVAGLLGLVTGVPVLMLLANLAMCVALPVIGRRVLPGSPGDSRPVPGAGSPTSSTAAPQR